MLKDFPRGDAAFVRLDRDRRAVAVRAADHQHMVAAQAMVAREDISWQVAASQMTDMQVAIGVGPSY